MPIFSPYQGGDPFQVGQNMNDIVAGQKAIGESMYGGVEKLIQSKQEMDVLRSTTQAIMSQYSTDESGKPSDAAPKYIHDLYKAVEKEGGIQGLSKSNLVSVLKGYETGFQVDAQRIQTQQAQQAITLRGLEISKAQREEEEYKKIALAHKLAMEYAGTPVGKTEIATAPTTTSSSGSAATTTAGSNTKAQPTAQPTAQPILGKEKPADKQKTSNQKPNTDTAERDALEEKLNKESANDSIDKLQKELNQSLAILARARIATKEYAYGDGQVGVAPKTLDEIRADKEKEKVLIPKIDNLKKQIAELKSIADKPLPEVTAKPAGATPVSTEAIQVGNGRLPSMPNELYRVAVEHLKDWRNSPEVIDAKLAKLKDEVALLETLIPRQKDQPTLMSEFAEWITDKNRVAGVTYPTRDGWEYVTRGGKEVNDLALKKQQIDILTADRLTWDAMQGVVAEGAAYTNPIGPTGKPAPEPIPAPQPESKPVPSSIAPKATSKPISKQPAKPVLQPSPASTLVNSKPEQKSDDEKITEEYGILTSRLRALNSVPLNWSEETFRQLRGYAPKIRFLQQGPVVMVGIGDKWQVVKAGGDQLSPSELASAEKHAILKSAIRTDTLSNKKWTFRGDIRTTESDTAGKVKKSVTDSTRALEQIDKLLDLGETGLWDSLTPNEKSGAIEGITNAVQAAGRTEIAGSGAFSEQDAKKLESIVPSLSSLSGAVFRQKSLEMLKVYRERIASQVQDIGRTWGFEVSEASNTGLTKEQVALIRDTYLELVKQGHSHEEAKQLALQSLQK